MSWHRAGNNSPLPPLCRRATISGGKETGDGQQQMRQLLPARCLIVAHVCRFAQALGKTVDFWPIYHCGTEYAKDEN
jgi:hypothetical protein